MRFGQVVERIDGEARDLRPGRMALTVASTPFFVAGWLVGQALRAAWLVVAWVWTAAVVGFRMARGG